jgi:MraZ protein
MAFRGTYQHTLDAKHRLTIPARFRDDFEEGLVAVKGVDPCVELWRVSEYEAHVEAATQNYAAMSPELRQTLRLMQGSAFDTTPDKVGRVGLTAQLMQHGGLEKDVVLVGTGRCIELWDRARWDQVEAGLPATVNQIAAQTSSIPGAGA